MGDGDRARGGGESGLRERHAGGEWGGALAPGRRFAFESPEADRVVVEAMKGIGEEIGRMRIPGLAGVVMGGGYGRGEGGVWGDGKLSNDLDFFLVTEEGAGERSTGAIAAAVGGIGARWTEKLGLDVDFCVKTPWRLRHDQERLMVQELVRGYCDVAGKPGEELFAGVERREASALPWSEAVRLLVNRGAGLLMAMEEARGRRFAVRNVNKCILGAGDARLIARGQYRWRAVERAEALGDAAYSRALEWKFRPKEEGPCGWEEAREAWLAATEEVRGAGRAGRSAYQAARWVARRRTLGDWRTLGMDPVARIWREMEGAVRGRKGLSEGMRRDWAIFN
jgi:hypothetical protein